MLVSVLVPVYNEEKTILKILNLINLQRKNVNLEILVSNDGSTDGTSKILHDNNNLYDVLVESQNNLGKGAALKYGALKAKNKWILTTDIDLSVSLNQLKKWNNKGYINLQAKEIYFGSRELKSSIVKTKFYRKVLGSFFRMFYKFFLGINLKDTQCGFKLYKKDIAKKYFPLYNQKNLNMI